MYEKTEQAMTISCDACRAVCVVASDHAEKWMSYPGDGAAPARVVIEGRVGIVLRKGGIDHRHLKSEGSIKLPNGQRVVAIRSYPYLCEECHETGGADKLGPEWKRLRSGTCPRCQGVTVCFEDEPERCCRACREAGIERTHGGRP